MTGPPSFFPGSESSVVTPSAALGSGKGSRKIRPVVLATFQRAMFSLLRSLSSPLAWRVRALAGAYLCDPPRRGYTLLLCPVGASGTVLALENAVALGGRKLMFLGWCGSLNPACPMTHVVVPTLGIREEGTSYHYLPADHEPSASDALVEAIVAALGRHGIPHTTGTVWTTDAPYRETRTKVRRHADGGALAVDMETSAIFALAAYHGLEAAGVLVVSDELFGDTWNPAWRRHAVFRPRLVAVARSMVDCCAGLGDAHP